MRRTFGLVAVVVAACAVATVRASASPAQDGDLAARAVSEDPAAAAAAVARLRDLGPSGLATFLAAHAEEIASPSGDPARRARCLGALDAIAGQKDADASRLYWHTDLARAVAAARAQGRPILSLRLLGRLDEDCSCANSRFFRTALYANERVSRVLREEFVLHWSSERPVPRVTIDFGDGRTLVRTVTGNSAHYVLDSEGRPVDALPGLYGPEAFLRGLARAKEAALAASALEPGARDAHLRSWHAEALRALERSFALDLARVGRATGRDAPPTGATPTAAEAAPAAVGKFAVERPLVAAALSGTGALAEATDAATWDAIAALHGEDARLDASSVALMRRKTPTAAEAGARATTKEVVEDPLLRVVRRFEDSIAKDSVRNEYRFHARVHAWFADGAGAGTLEALNERVYAELFLTPRSDPWLGLVPEDAYAALDGG
jgi:hypothetical protein